MEATPGLLDSWKVGDMNADSNPTTAATITFSDGEQINVTTKDVDYAYAVAGENISARVSEAMKDTPMMHNLIRLDIDLKAMTNIVSIDSGFELEDTSYVFSGGDRYGRIFALRTDIPYYVMTDLDVDLDDEGNASESALLTCEFPFVGEDASRWDVEDVRLIDNDGVEATVDSFCNSQESESGEIVERSFGDYGLDPQTLTSSVHVPTGNRLIFADILGGLFVMAGTIEAAELIRKKRREKKKKGEAPPKLDAVAPNRHYVPIAKTTVRLTDPNLFESGMTLDVGKKKGQMQITFDLEYKGEAISTGGENSKPSVSIQREDVRLISAVVTLKMAGNTTVSPFQIAEAMGYSNPSPEIQADIHERFMKLRDINGRIDWTEQARAYGVVNPDTGLPLTRAETIGHLVNANVFDGEDEGGNPCIRYTLLSDPVTYQHAHQVGQVIDYPQSLKAIKPIRDDGTVAKRMTREQTQIADTILEWIYILKGPSSMNNTMSYDALFERTGLTFLNNRHRQTAIKFVIGYLRALQKIGEIDGFEAIQLGRAHKQTSVRIFVRKESVKKRRRR